MSIHDTTQTVATLWRLDASNSSAEFRVPHFWGLVPIKGRFERVDGWLARGQKGYCELEFKIDATSVNTGNTRRERTCAQATSSTPTTIPRSGFARRVLATPVTDVSRSVVN